MKFLKLPSLILQSIAISSESSHSDLSSLASSSSDDFYSPLEMYSVLRFGLSWEDGWVMSATSASAYCSIYSKDFLAISLTALALSLTSVNRALMPSFVGKVKPFWICFISASICFCDLNLEPGEMLILELCFGHWLGVSADDCSRSNWLGLLLVETCEVYPKDSYEKHCWSSLPILLELLDTCSETSDTVSSSSALDNG